MTNFNRPTLKNLRDRAVSDINANMNGADASLRRRFLNIIAIACAGIGDEILRRNEFLLKQAFVQEAEGEYIVKHGQTYDFSRKMATKSSGNISIPATPGSILPAGTALKRSDGATYTSAVEAEATLDGVCTVKITADNVGKDGNASSGTIISLLSPVSGFEAKGTVDELGLTGGTDIESMDSYLERLLLFIRNPSTGGNKTDYEIWAREVPGVTRAWCYPTESGAGTVTVRFMMDDTYNNGIPLPGDVQRVKNHIAGYQPATAIVYVEAPVPDAVNFVFGSLDPDTTDDRTAVQNKLKSLIQSSSVEPGSTLRLSKIRGAISTATGNEDFTLTSPTADIDTATGHIAVLGTITYPVAEND